MRTACLVIALALFSIAMPGFSQPGLDQDITVMGGDESALPVPPPSQPGPPGIPTLDLRIPTAPEPAPEMPPSGSSLTLPNQRPFDPISGASVLQSRESHAG